MEGKEIVNAGALANLFGISERSVRQLAGRGIVVRAGRGAYRVGESVRAYCQHLREIAGGRGGEEGILELTAERARLAKEQADGHAIRNATLRGELVEAGAVAREWAEILRLVRSGVLALPSRLQQRVPHLTASDIAAIDAEVRTALAGIGNDDDRRRAPPGAGDADTAAAP